jgi:hypothetical protein
MGLSQSQSNFPSITQSPQGADDWQLAGNTAHWPRKTCECFATVLADGRTGEIAGSAVAAAAPGSSLQRFFQPPNPRGQERSYRESVRISSIYGLGQETGKRTEPRHIPRLAGLFRLVRNPKKLEVLPVRLLRPSLVMLTCFVGEF